MIAELTFSLLLAAPAPLAAEPQTVPAQEPWVVCGFADQDAACVHLGRAEALLRDNKPRAAGRELERALRARRAAGQYAGEELWQLAAFRFQAGQHRRAARTLDELAREAQRAGDLGRQTAALMEAAYLYTSLKDRPAASARLERLLPLLDSPYLPLATSDAIRARLIGV